MNNTNLLNIAFEDLFKLTHGLIVDDLKVQKHLYHLSLGGLHTTLQLTLYRGVFVLAGFKESDITEELEDWYFGQTQRVNGIEITPDEQALSDLAAEILEGLLRIRNEHYSKKVTS